jgi:hypothetical protein
VFLLWNKQSNRPFSYISRPPNKIVDGKLPKYSKSRSFWGEGGEGELRPYLDPLETLSGPQTSRRLSLPLTQNPGSAPGRCHLKLSIWSCDSPDFLITPGIRILGTGADTLNSVQASYFESFHWPGSAPVSSSGFKPGHSKVNSCILVLQYMTPHGYVSNRLLLLFCIFIFFLLRVKCKRFEMCSLKHFHNTFMLQVNVKINDKPGGVIYCRTRIQLFTLLCPGLNPDELTGADPGFCVRGDESRRGVWGPLTFTKCSKIVDRKAS